MLRDDDLRAALVQLRDDPVAIEGLTETIGLHLRPLAVRQAESLHCKLLSELALLRDHSPPASKSLPRANLLDDFAAQAAPNERTGAGKTFAPRKLGCEPRGRVRGRGAAPLFASLALRGFLLRLGRGVGFIAVGLLRLGGSQD